MCRCGPRHANTLTPAVLPPQARTHQENHIQALQLGAQGLLAEDEVHPELLGLATGQLALQVTDPQEALARREERADRRVGFLVDGRRATILGVSCLIDLTLSDGNSRW